ncbi:MAG: hypothetical protein RLZZ282_1648, partial [Verrucomicrobiota bacterium]
MTRNPSNNDFIDKSRVAGTVVGGRATVFPNPHARKTVM